MQVLFEVAPSGKIKRGDLFDLPSSIDFCLSAIVSTNSFFCSGVPPRGQGTPSAPENSVLTIGILVT
jgi:hypothetical protein